MKLLQQFLLNQDEEFFIRELTRILDEQIKENKTKEPHEVFVNNDVENPKQLQLKGKSYDLVKAMADLRKAMEPFFDMGYHIGVTLYKRP